MGKCRGENCGAEIRWGMKPDGKGVPMDPDPDPDGNLVRTGVPSEVGGAVPVRHVRKGEDTGDAVRFMAHFATCPDAANFRRPR